MVKTSLLKKALPLLLCSFFIVIGLSLVFADNDDSKDDDDNNNKSEDVKYWEEKIKEYEKKVSSLQNESNSLTREISESDAQINLTESRIQHSLSQIKQKEEEISKIAIDIDNLQNRIERLQDSIKYQEDVLNERSRSRYKNSKSSPLVLLFGSDNFKDLIQRTKYLEVLELQDNKLITEMSKTKNNYGQQKDLFEKKKAKEVSLKSQVEQEKANLEKYKVDLDSKKRQKQSILAKTQNDEQKYQDLLASAKRELNQITGAVSVLKGKSGEKVKKGDLIGIQGNTGYSNGDHLHFGVYRYSSFAEIDGWNWYYSNLVDPAKKLRAKAVYWNDGCQASGTRTVGSGSWQWPLNSPTVSQGYGNTCWSRIYYGGKPHPAYDMYGPYGSGVYAVEDGEAYYCRNCLGDGGNGVFIFHEDNYMTLYWHLR